MPPPPPFLSSGKRRITLNAPSPASSSLPRWSLHRRGSLPHTTIPTPSSTPPPPQPQAPLDLETPRTSYTTFSIPAQHSTSTATSPPSTPSPPFLLLPGDIGSLAHLPLYSQFLATHAPYYKHIFLVLGNHEFYNLPSPSTYAHGITLANSLPRSHPFLSSTLTVLNRTRVDLPDHGVTVLGCTLWSHITSAQSRSVAAAVNDFRGRIGGGWTIETHNAQFREDVSWLQSTLATIDSEDRTGTGDMGSRWGRGPDSNPNPPRGTAAKSKWRVIIVTHHAPTFYSTSKPIHKDSPINTAFATELLSPGEQEDEHGVPPFSAWKGADKVSTWAFGHTHFCTNWVWEGLDPGGEKLMVRVVANQRGYWISNEGTGFDPGLVVEV
ncbi:hypothetical protein BDZ91DRAFT_716696 [Kalaharituber pfeilii]|nr:hypothetical protein BDZ91DRAFT_716696 [Kalaharituber pfeilii]